MKQKPNTSWQEVVFTCKYNVKGKQTEAVEIEFRLQILRKIKKDGNDISTDIMSSNSY